MSIVKYHILYLNNSCDTNNLSVLYYNLFYIQKKIYIASKECHNSLVQSLQKLLVNSCAMQYLATYLNTQYCIILTQKYQQEKLLLNKSVNYNKIIKAWLKQESNNYITYWCLQPEWLAKQENNEISKMYLFNNYVHKYTYLLNHHQYTKYTYFYIEQDIDTSISSIDVKYLTSKLQTIKWIQYQVKKLLFKKCLKEFNSNFKLQNKKLVNTIHYNLYNLLNQVLLIGIEWVSIKQNTNKIKQKVSFINIIYMFNVYILITTNYKVLYLIQAKLINFLYHVGRLKFYSCIYSSTIHKLNNTILVISDQVSLQIHQQNLTKLVYTSISLKTCKFLLRNIKNFLYHKNALKYFRFNSYLNYKTINSILNTQFKIIYDMYNHLILNKEFKYISLILSYILRKLKKTQYVT